MTRAFSLACLALFLIGISGANAMAKPSIAILGLEVVEPSGTPTAADTQVGRELTDGLRARAKVGSGTYAAAPGSDKELIDQKLLNNCDDEGPKCMAAIGNQLGADFLMYGRVQKDGKSYKVTLKLLDVRRVALVRSATTDVIPGSEASGGALLGWSRKLYAKATGGDASGGTLTVKLGNGVERGTILIDGQPSGTINNGTGTTGQLPDGKYRLSVESEGFRRWEKDVTVKGGSTTIDADLEPGGAPDITPPGGVEPGERDEVGKDGTRGSSKWRKAFYGATAVGLAAGIWHIYSWRELRGPGGVEEQLCLLGARHERMECAGYVRAPESMIKPLNDRGESLSTQTTVATVIWSVASAAFLFTGYKGFIAKNPATKERQAKRGRRVSRDRFVVTPIMSPNGGGATIRIDW